MLPAAAVAVAQNMRRANSQLHKRIAQLQSEVYRLQSLPPAAAAAEVQHGGRYSIEPVDIAEEMRRAGIGEQ
eukprot:SAG11_NODE_4357_length_1934_cov_1.202725_5_plen_72_part_00